MKAIIRTTLAVFGSSALVASALHAADRTDTTVYVRCDDGEAGQHAPVGFAINSETNTVAVTEYRMTVSEVTAISFGPESVTFNVINDRGGKTEFTISRIDASVTSRNYYAGPARMPSLGSWGETFEYSGCGLVEAPSSRAF